MRARFRWFRGTRVIAGALVLACSAGSVVAAEAQPAGGGEAGSRLDTRLRRVVAEQRAERQQVIIRVRAGAIAAVRRHLTARGDAVLHEHRSIDSLTALVSSRDLAALSHHPGVLGVSSDAGVQASGQLLGGLLGTVLNVAGGLLDTVGGVLHTAGTIVDPRTPTAGPAVTPAFVRATLGVPATWSGRGVGVAVIDSGLEMSSEFQGRVTAFYDFTGGRAQATTASDDYGHGTHVASTIGGSGALSYNREHRGLAPGVRFVVLKVLDANGAGQTSDVIRAIDFAVAHRVRFGIDIINLSLGHPIYEPAATDPLVQAVERATDAGLIVVAAAGNFGRHPETGVQGYAGVTSPGNAPSAITVGALATGESVKRSDDRIADYSSAGPTWYDAHVKPDIVAPGHNLVAAAARRGTLYRTYPHLRHSDSDYMRLSGTSMATAVGSGAVALMLEAHRQAHPDAPALTPNAVKAALHYTALDVRNDLGLPYDPLRQGAGALNGKGALEMARAIDPARPSGSYWVASMPSPWTSIGGETNAWGQGIIWGSSVLWGNAVFVNQRAWAAGIIWGSQVTWSSGIIWGSNVVWGESARTWSSGIIWGSHTIGASSDDGIIWGSSGSTAAGTSWKTLTGEETALR
jgi:serine protease AprX